jgi:folate-binding protein YgfZ
VGLRPWQASPFKDGIVLGLPEVLGVRRGLFVGPVADAQLLRAALPALDASAWRWLDVMSGIPRIEAATVDRFVPQMINFELIGGVNFQKGCYPGQEVVARSQYRGTTKRRAFIMHAAQAMHPGQDVFSAADPGQPAGMVVNAASVGDAHSALVELKLSALGSALHAGAPDGPSMTPGELPYALPSAEEAA